MVVMAMWPTGWTAVGAFPWPGPPQALADAQQDTLDAAVHLIQQATIAHRDGKHNRLLKSLRHLDDPSIRPLFAQLAKSQHPTLKIHGVLGLAETHPDKQIDLALIAEIDDPAVQGAVITAAMDDQLLHNDQATQLLAWSGLADEVKLLVAVRLLGSGTFDDTELLHHAMTNARKLGGGALAAMLLMQLQDPGGEQHLRSTIDTSDDPQRDPVRAMLLRTALRHDLSRVGPWALSIAGEPDVNPVLGLLALRTALRFSVPGADTLWLDSYHQAHDSPAQRVRLALTALNLSPWVEPALFDVIRESEDPFLSAVGKAGSLIAQGSSDVADPVIALLDFNHMAINPWALGYARERASETDAQIILLGLILAYQDSPPRGKARRLDEAIQAVQALYERDPLAAANLLRPVLSDASTDKLLVQAVLLGLVRAQSPNAVAVVSGIEDQLNSADAKALALLLHARSDRPMDAQQMDELSLLARGGSRLEDSLRIQAAWTYLKRTGLAEEALRRVLGSDNL